MPPRRGIEKHRLIEVSKKVDEIMNKIEFGNTTELNNLVYAGAVVLTKTLGVKNRISAGMHWNHGGKGNWRHK